MANTNDINVKINIGANITNFEKSLGIIKNGFAQLKIPNNLSNSLQKNISTIEKELDNLKSKTSTGKLDLLDSKSVNESTRKIINNFSQIEQKLGSKAFSQLKLNVNFTQLDNANKQVHNYEKALESAQKAITELEAKQSKLNGSINITGSVAKQEKIVGNYESKLKSEKENLEKLQQQARDLYGPSGSNPKQTFSEKDGNFSYRNMSASAKELQTQIEEAANKVTDLQNRYSGAKSKLEDLSNQQRNLPKDIEEAKRAAEQLDTEFAKLKSSLSNLKLSDTKGKLIDFSNVSNFDELKQKLESLNKESAQTASAVIHNLTQAGKEGGRALGEIGKDVDNGVRALGELTERQKEIDSLYNSLTQFFSISSGVNLFKRAIKEAFSAIKELDSAMTEVAVVTDFSVGDMWDQLPEYTSKANELGLAISDVYDASALYYQQGLNTAEVNSLVTSTLQMARIASLDASVATDRMTNAMRGFNMEINETNASHVADVYSNLAAKSASNVDELSTAMTKTASIASSANMSFENTAAFLAQGIETTRESADTIGTMLKTVIGRFTEVKEAWTSGDLTAESEGEEINVNKVAKALRAADINLNDFFTGAKGLDEILIDLSSKWDSLDLVTQRYIATQAAGSRQQSRFIALMQDYKRQQELIGYAYNSSGAAENQYEKTLDSLETKLNSLKNAWDTFTMGIANNAVVKAGIDLLTNILTVVNNLTDKLGAAGNMLANTGIAIGGFLGSKKILKGLFSQVVGAFVGKESEWYKNFISAGEKSGQGFISGFKNTFSNVDFKGALTGSFNGLRGNFTSVWDKTFSIDASNKEKIQQDLKDIYNSNFDSSKIEAFNAKYQELGLIIDTNQEKMQKNQATMKAMGMALMGVATVCGIISSKLNDMGQSNAAKTFQNIATAVGLVGTAFISLSSILKEVEGASKILLAIGAAITAIVAIVSYFDAINESAAEKTERLNEALKSSQEAARASAQAYEDLKTNIDNLENSQNALDGLIEGTQEFQEALIAANQEVLNLLDTYPQLASYLTTNKYGGLDVSKEGLEFVQQQQLKASERAQANTLMAQIASNINTQDNADANYADSFKEWIITEQGSFSQRSGGLKDAFETAYSDWKNKGTTGIDDLVQKIQDNFTGEIDLQGFDNLTSLVESWMGLYEANSASQLSTYTDNKELLQQLYQTSMSNDIKQSKYADLMDYYATQDTTTLDKTAHNFYTKYTNKRGDAGGDISQLASGLINGDYDELISASDAKSIITDPSGGKETYRQIYQALIGFEADEEKTVSQMMTEISNVLAAYDSMDNAEEMITFMEKFAAEGETQKKAAETLTSILSQTADKDTFEKIISGKDIKGVLGLNNDQFTELREGMGFNEENYGSYEAALDAFLKQIQDMAKQQQKRYNDEYSQLSIALSQAKVDQSEIKSLDGKLSIEEIEISNDILSNLGDNLTPEIASTFTDALNSDTINVDQIKWLEDLNFADSITSFDQIQQKLEELNDRTKYTKEEAEELGNLYNQIGNLDAFSTSNQVTQLYSELGEDLDDIQEKNGEITTDNIEKLATSGSKLSKVLKNTSATAAGLATIFNGLKSGDIVLNGLTDRVIDFISTLSSTEDKIKQTQDRLSEFKEFDTGAGMDTLASWSDKAKEYVDNLEYANAVDILEEFFGEDYIKSKIGNWKQMTEDELDTAIRQLSSDMENLTSNDGFNALYSFLGDVENQDSVLGQIANAYIGSDGIGYVDIDYSALAKNGATLDDLANELTATGMSFDAALTVLSTIAARDYKFDKVLDENNYKNAIEQAEGNVYSQEELKNMGAATGRSAAEVQLDLGLAQYKKSGGVTQYGNVDLQNREAFYDNQGDLNTVQGTSGTYATQTGTIEISYTPLLQTGTGTPLDLTQSGVIDTYFNQLLANAGGDYSEENLLKLDAAGLDIEGQHISNLMIGLGADMSELPQKATEAAQGIIKAFALLDEDGNELLGQDLHESLTSALVPEGYNELTQAGMELNQIANLTGTTYTNLRNASGIQYDQLISSLQSMGLSLDQAQSEADSLASTLNTTLSRTIEVPIMVEDESGNLTQDGVYEMTVTADDSAALETISETVLQAQTIGDAVKAAFEEGAVSVTIDTKATEENLGTVKSDLGALIEQANNGADFDIDDNSDEVITHLEAINNTSLDPKTLYITEVRSSAPVGLGVPKQSKAHAHGTGRTKQDETALTGEMGQELVVTGDQWYTVGDHGPEFAKIPAGSIVFNARQTHDLLTRGRTNTHGKAWAHGTAYAGYKPKDSVPNYSGSSSSSSSPSSSSANNANTAAAASSAQAAAESAEEAAEIWINTLDKLYNLVEYIEEETRKRQILEKQYEQALRKQNVTLDELSNNFNSQLTSLNQSLEYQKQLQAGRLKEINDVANERYKMGDNVTTYAGSGATDYARYNQSTNTIEIDWERIDAITDKDLGDAVEAYISRLEKLQDQYEDTYDEILNIEDEIYELRKAALESYSDFTQRVYDALVQEEQDRIDELENMYTQMEEDNSNVLNALREQIELERQIRDNTEKEKEIADKENELAYLRRDTSNGNLVAIKKLEQELAELRESYADDLIDQKLDHLADDNEKAAAQRDMQIEQLNSILEYNQSHGEFWDKVQTLMTNAFGGDGEMNINSELVTLLKDTDSFKAMSEVDQYSWMKELAAAYVEAQNGAQTVLPEVKKQQEENERKGGKQWYETTGVKLANGATVHYDPNTGKWRTGQNDKWGWDLAFDAKTGKYQNVNGKQIIPDPPKSQNQTASSNKYNVDWNQAKIYYDNVIAGRWGNGSARDAAARRAGLSDTSGKMGQYALNALYMHGIGFEEFKRRVLSGVSPSSFGGTNHFPNITAFKTGGLADFSGPAWLDGSKAHPELVLNARDTENFMYLTDILSDAIKNTNASYSTTGDNYFDITIQVEEIGSDYDVEKLTTKIKDEIKKDSMYRNVNTLNFLR